ncbi:Signal transduction histidine kinase [Kandleria vitulina]|uniref:sensor histidine kinase n=1 Tax=Kandleria vitulina TaxID=1630 RepID=UPI0008C0ABB4|nr:HAMP domain-containing sensor histidine kinase [Kandleria vitulina]SEJ08538.1 Signal transduction histidine kinase [Kandleria vitulina]
MSFFKKKSFIRTSVVHFTVFSVLILAVFLGFMLIYAYMLDIAFTDMEDVLKYKDDIISEHFSNIPIESFKKCSFIVFNDDNDVIYSSNESIKEDIRAVDLELIERYNSGYNYSITQYESGKYKNGFYVQKVKKIKDGTLQSTGYAILDNNLRVVEGNLFNKSSLSPYEFNLISGKFIDSEKNEFTVSKYEYVNKKGKRRVFVFINPTFKEEDYSNLEDKLLRFIPIPILLIIIIIFIQTMLFDRKIKKSIQPLNKAMLSYSKGEPQKIDKDEMPREFFYVVDTFEDLMNELEISEQEKEKANAERQRVIVDLSHDLKTPLTVIQGYAKALADHVVPEEKQEQYLQTLAVKANASASLMDTLFAYTRMEHPEYHLNLSEVDLHEWFRDYIYSKNEEISLKGFRVETDIPDDIELAQIDLNLFPRALDNLLNNSLKYNVVGTKIYYSVNEKNDKITIIYADDGVGISEEVGERIFDAFVTTNEARTSGKGTGLGMSIAKRIIELHGGTIELDSLEGYKTVFKIQLKRIFTE